MFEVLPPDLLASSHEMQRDEGMAWLYEIEVDNTTLQRPVFSLTDAEMPISFAGVTYEPFPMKQSVIVTDTEGSLPSVDVTMSNLRRDLVRYLEAGQGMIRRPVLITLVDRGLLTPSTNRLDHPFRVAGAEISNEHLLVRLAEPNGFQEYFPREFIDRDRCGKIFKGKWCLYRGPETSCPKTYSACTNFGNLAVARGYPRLWPRLFGGFPAVPIKVA